MRGKSSGERLHVSGRALLTSGDAYAILQSASISGLGVGNEQFVIGTISVIPMVNAFWRGLLLLSHPVMQGYICFTLLQWQAQARFCITGSTILSGVQHMLLHPLPAQPLHAAPFKLDDEGNLESIFTPHKSLSYLYSLYAVCHS